MSNKKVEAMIQEISNWKPVLLGAVLLASSAAAIAADTWTQRKAEAGVTISSRPSTSSPINDIRSETRMKTSMDSLISLMRDYSARPRWDVMCGEIKVLKKEASAETVYVHLKMPWPVTDRDLVMRVEWKQDPVTGVISQHAYGTPDAAPPVEGRVRMTSFVNDWTFTPKGDGTIAVDSIANANPGGGMPTWMINKLSSDAPLQAMKKMKDIAEAGYSFKGATTFMTKH